MISFLSDLEGLGTEDYFSWTLQSVVCVEIQALAQWPFPSRGLAEFNAECIVLQISGLSLTYHSALVFCYITWRSWVKRSLQIRSGKKVSSRKLRKSACCGRLRPERMFV